MLFTITALAGCLSLACSDIIASSGVTQPVDTADVPLVTSVFSDDFESGTLSKWQDGVNADKHSVITDASRAKGGSRYLEITYPGGGDGGWLTRFFMPGYDSLYVSYDVQFEANWTGGTKLLNIRGSRTDNQWSSFGQAGKCPDGSQWFATNVVMLVDENPGPIRFYTYFPGMQPENDGVTCWGRHSGMGVTNYTGTSTISRGVWHRVEVFVSSAPRDRATACSACGWTDSYAASGRGSRSAVRACSS